jgi:hypothetical protein
MNPRRCYRCFSRIALKLQTIIFLLFLCILFALNASAFKSPLQPEEVEDSYSLGQSSNHEEIRDFLSQY